MHISANDHGARILKDNPQLERRLDYIVACDKQAEKRARADCKPDRDGKPWEVPVITRHCYGDYRLLHMAGKSSGMCGAYLARVMGCAPIIITGMDCYVGPTYYDDHKAFSTGRNFDERTHVDRWLAMIKQYPGQYRAIGCSRRLAERIGVYDPAEVPQPVTDTARLLAELRGVYIRFSKDARLSNSRQFSAGDVVELTSGEAAQQIRRRVAARLRSAEVEQCLRQQHAAPIAAAALA